jgi:hypothetical protein
LTAAATRTRPANGDRFQDHSRGVVMAGSL